MERFMRSKNISIVVSAFIMLLIPLFRIEDKYFVLLLLSAILSALVITVQKKRNNITIIDISVFLFFTYDCLSVFSADCRLPAFQRAIFSTFYLNFYIVLRYVFCIKDIRNAILNGSLFFITLLFTLAIFSFYVYHRNAMKIGFYDIYHLRFLYKPLGYSVNVWAEILIVLLGWLCVAKKHLLFLSFFCILLIFLSFSRGAYISLMVFIILILLIIRQKKIKVILLASYVSAFALTLYFFPKEMSTTLNMNQTESQKLSTEKRLNASCLAWKSFQKKPLCGYGNDNFTFAVDASLYQDSRQAMTTLPPNILVQLLVEKGCIGIMLFCFLSFSIIRFCWLQRNHNRILFLITCIALFIKEMSLASMLSEPAIILCMLFMLAFILQGEPKLTSSPKLCYFIPLMGVLSFALWNIACIKNFVDPTASLINNSLRGIAQYKISKKKTHLIDAENMIYRANSIHPNDVQIRYLLSEILYLKGDEDKSVEILNKLTKDYPYNSLYWLKLSKIQYERNQKGEAIQSLVNAIHYYPRILNNEYVKSLKFIDPHFFATLTARLGNIKPSSLSSAAEYARCGYIANWCRNKDAGSYFKTAVSILPSLSTPWYYLGDIPKYNLLVYGAYKKTYSPEIIPIKEFTDEQLFNHLYSPKFQTWYHDTLLYPPI